MSHGGLGITLIYRVHHAMRLYHLILLCMLLTACCNGQDAPRKVKRRVEPQYPELARRINVSGTVRLELLIAPDGAIKNVKPLGGNPLLIQAAEDAVNKWRYEPGPEALQIVEFQFRPLN